MQKINLFSQLPTYESFRDLKHFYALDGMRAIGVVLVIFEHYGGDGLKILSGWLGVDIFFIISGFLITTILLREQEEVGKVSLLDFYIRRAFRILPVYYLVLAIVIIQTYSMRTYPYGGAEGWNQLQTALPYYLTLFNEQSFGPAPWKLTWTMGIEWKFYLVWPVVAFILPLGIKKMGLITTLVVVLLGFSWNVPQVQAAHYIVLMMGSIMAILLNNKSAFNVLRWLMNPIASFVLFGCVIAMQLYGIHHLPSWGGYGGGQGILCYSVAVAFFLATLFGKSPINKFLSTRLLSYIGCRSYSLYLIQILAWQAVVGMDPTMKPSPMGAFLTTVVGLIFASAVYSWVEKPMISIGKKILAKNHSFKNNSIISM